MRTAAIVATKFGHTAVTMEYTNQGTEGALAQDVQDVVAVTKALPRNTRRAAIGFSMGGAILTMALARTGVERATLVAPGKYLSPHYYSRLEIMRRFVAEIGEAADPGIIGNLRNALWLGATSLMNYARRPWAVHAELVELLRDPVWSALREAKARPNPPYVRFMYGLHDRLLPAEAQRASIADLPFDEVVGYRGEHGRLTYDPTLAADIFERDSLLV